MVRNLGTGGIGDEAFEAAFREGQSMRLKNAIALGARNPLARSFYAYKGCCGESVSHHKSSNHGAPNNSFNRSANSGTFIRKTMLVIMVRRARLIRALCRSFNLMV